MYNLLSDSVMLAAKEKLPPGGLVFTEVSVHRQIIARKFQLQMWTTSPGPSP